MEVVKFQQAQLINSDLDMYYAKTDTPALCRTSSLVEELGQIEYVFSDKTGTLTCNEMEFRFCSIGGVAYADVVEESRRGDGEDGKDGWRSFAEMKALLGAGDNPFGDFTPSDADSQGEKEVVNEFLTLLAVCHTVIPEMRDGKLHYQASSPDEAALVAGASCSHPSLSVGLWHFWIGRWTVTPLYTPPPFRFRPSAYLWAPSFFGLGNHFIASGIICILSSSSTHLCIRILPCCRLRSVIRYSIAAAVRSISHYILCV